MRLGMRHIGAEFLGTALLVMSVVGSGIMAQNLTQDVGLQLLANAIATGGALLGLITIFGPLAGASFNPGYSGDVNRRSQRLCASNRW